MDCREGRGKGKRDMPARSGCHSRHRSGNLGTRPQYLLHPGGVCERAAEGDRTERRPKPHRESAVSTVFLCRDRPKGQCGPGTLHRAASALSPSIQARSLLKTSLALRLRRGHSYRKLSPQMTCADTLAVATQRVAPSGPPDGPDASYPISRNSPAARVAGRCIKECAHFLARWHRKHSPRGWPGVGVRYWVWWGCLPWSFSVNDLGNGAAQD